MSKTRPIKNPRDVLGVSPVCKDDERYLHLWPIPVYSDRDSLHLYPKPPLPPLPKSWYPKVFLDKKWPSPRPSPNESICYVPRPMDKRPQDEPEKGF